MPIDVSGSKQHATSAHGTDGLPSPYSIPPNFLPLALPPALHCLSQRTSEGKLILPALAGVIQVVDGQNHTRAVQPQLWYRILGSEWAGRQAGNAE